MTSTANSSALRHWLFFVAASLATAVVLMAIGYYPTVKIAGGGAAAGMAAGCGASLLASCLGAIPLALAAVGRVSHNANAVLGSTLIRFMTVLIVVVPVAFLDVPYRKVFVSWLAISYLLMLAVDTSLAVRTLRRANDNGNP